MPNILPLVMNTAAVRQLFRLADPYFEGLEHVHANVPALYVANHTTLGVLDVPFLYMGLLERGIKLVGLAHSVHFVIPGARAFLHSIGIIEGTPENCRAAMERGEHILVFPGGGSEVMKVKGQKYQLLWKQRMGFVRLAMEHGYPIVPIAAVGAEECYDIVWDRRDYLKTPLGSLIARLPIKEDELPPVVKGWAGTPLPRPERFYFKVMPPMPTSAFKGQQNDDTVVQRFRQKVKDALEDGIGLLLEYRESDPKRPFWTRIKKRLSKIAARQAG